jgi:hypothetical protein
MGDEARRAPRRRHQRRRRPAPWDVGCGLFGWYRQLLGISQQTPAGASLCAPMSFRHRRSLYHRHSISSETQGASA